MEMMRSLLTRRRVTAAVVETRTHALHHRFDDHLVLTLHAVHGCIGTDAGTAPGRIPDIAQECNPSQIDAQWPHNVDRYSPRIEVEHRVGEEPEVICRDPLTVVRRRGRKIEADL